MRCFCWILKKCNLYIRNCSVNRELGFCNSIDKVKVARVALHFCEKSCISVENGSITVFFSNYNLKCVFCQNSRISHEENDKKITVKSLSKLFWELFWELQSIGANNINLVTPTHFE